MCRGCVVSARAYIMRARNLCVAVVRLESLRWEALLLLVLTISCCMPFIPMSRCTALCDGRLEYWTGRELEMMFDATSAAAIACFHFQCHFLRKENAISFLSSAKSLVTRKVMVTVACSAPISISRAWPSFITLLLHHLKALCEGLYW